MTLLFLILNVYRYCKQESVKLYSRNTVGNSSQRTHWPLHSPLRILMTRQLYMTQEEQSPDGSSNFLEPRRNIPSTLSYPMGHTAQSRYKAGGGATGECEHQEAGTPWGPPRKLSTLLPFLHCSLSTECLYPLICLPYFYSS